MSRLMLCGIVSCLVFGAPTPARANGAEDRAARFVESLGGTVVRDEKRAPIVDGDPDRTAQRPVAGIEKAAENLYGRARRFAVRERNEDDLVAAVGLAIPRSMLADEHAVLEFRKRRSR